MFKVGIRLVRSNRSNPALKQGLAKARFLQKEYYPTNIFSAAAEAKPGWRLFWQNPWPVPPLHFGGTQTLLLAKPVKKFASDRDE